MADLPIDQSSGLSGLPRLGRPGASRRDAIEQMAERVRRVVRPTSAERSWDQVHEEARRTLLERAKEMAQASSYIYHDTSDDSFWYLIDPTTGLWEQQDPIQLASGNLSPITDDLDNPIRRIDEVDLGVPPLPEDDEPFIGGIPADFVSNRLVGERGDRVTGFGDLDEMDEKRIRTGYYDDVRFGVPVFRQFDEYNLFAGLPPAEIASWQNQLIRAGYLDEGDIAGQHGLFIGDTPDAMREAMIDASVNGWEADLAGWLNHAGTVRDNMTDDEKLAAAGIRPFVAPAYIAPDYASLAQTARAAMSQQLGRDAHDWEVKLLANELNRDFRRQFDVQVAAMRSEFDAGNRAILDEESQAAGAFTDISPLDRLQELILTNYETEIDTQRRVEETGANTRLLMSNLAGLERAI